MLKQITSLLEAVKYRGGVHALLNARPRSLTSWLITNRLRQLGLDFHTIIDGGANIGQFARAAHLCFPNARIYSFEPLPDIAEELRCNMATVSAHRVFETALGTHDGEIDFYRHSYTQSSSARKVLDSADSLLAGQSTVVDSLKLPVARLDTVLKDEVIEQPALLKLDVQGFELEALRGGEEVLSKCDCVLVESVFDQQYEEEATFDELWAFLRSKGYRFNQPLNFVRSSSGKIVQIDALFSAATG